jgi:hypothetical protein
MVFLIATQEKQTIAGNLSDQNIVGDLISPPILNMLCDARFNNSENIVLETRG